MPVAPVWTRSLGPLVLADLRRRYAGSWLGGLWAVLGPLVEVAAYALAFGVLLGPAKGGGLDFALFVAAGLLPWAALREGLEGAAATLPDQRWIRRSLVPVELLVARQVATAGVRAAFGLSLVVLVEAGRGGDCAALGAPWLAAALLLQTLAAYGAGLVIAPLAVLYPDLRPALASGLTLLTFASPIVYPESALSGPLRAAIEWNPYTHLLRLLRGPLTPPAAPLGSLAVSVALAAGLLCLGTLLKPRLFWPARDRL